MKKHKSTLFLLIIFCVGLSLLLYPTVSDYWNSFHQSRTIATYAEQVAGLEEESCEQLRDEAAAYNRALIGKSERYFMTEAEREVYESLLNVSGNGIIGYIEIPEIKCSLPIYHGTDPRLADRGRAH